MTDTRNVFQKLFSSRKFMASVISIVVIGILQAFPSFAPFADQLTQLITALVMLFVVGTTIEDAAKSSKEAKAPEISKEALEAALKGLIEAGFEVTFETEEEEVVVPVEGAAERLG